MNCKACNTRLPSDARKCPHCGHTVSRGSFIDRPASSDPNEESQSAARGTLSPSSLSGVEDEMELSLDEAVGSKPVKARREAESTKPAASKPGVASRSDDKPKLRRPAAATRSAGPPPAARKVQSRREPKHKPPVDPAVGLVLEAEQVRHLVGEQPEALEPGLSVATDDDGHPVGIGYETEVGEIDLLARDADGDWVVVMVSPPEPGPEIVSDLLHRMGWVRKHLCEDDEKVRGIVVLDGMDDELGYAAAAVADSVDFRAWRLEVTFEAVDV